MLRSNCFISICPLPVKQPSLFMAHQRITSSFFSDRIHGGGVVDSATVVSSSSRLRDLVFIVNPQERIKRACGVHFPEEVYPGNCNALMPLKAGAMETGSSRRWATEWEDCAKPLITKVVSQIWD